MPDFWTHILGGEKILEGLADGPWKKTIEGQRKAFNFGCQGPDFFFYNDFWPWIKEKRGPEAGRKLQKEHIRDLFLTAADYLKEKKAEIEIEEKKAGDKKARPGHSGDFSILAAYFSGFLAHYALDKNCHPFIHSKTSDSTAHKRLEINLDTYLVEKIWLQKAYRLAPDAAIDLGNQLPLEIEDFYLKILPEVHGYPPEIDFIGDAYLDMKNVMGIFYSPRRVRSRLLLMLNPLVPNYDVSVLTYPRTYDRSLLTAEEYEQFASIFERAVEEGIELVEKILAYLANRIEREELAKSFPEISFDGLGF